MKLLIYGFKPYLDHKENISGKIAKKLKGIVFPAKFNKSFFLKAVRKHNPDVIVGLGQNSHSRKINIERKAVNLMGRKKGKKKPILKEKPKQLLVNLKLKTDKNSRISYNAGQYVCNYSMYLIMTYFKDIKFAFIHIPEGYDLGKAVKFVKKKIVEIRKA